VLPFFLSRKKKEEDPLSRKIQRLVSEVVPSQGGNEIKVRFYQITFIKLFEEKNFPFLFPCVLMFCF